MNPYEKLIDKCYNEEVLVIEKSFKSSSKGLWKDDKIGINKQILTNAEKACVLAEEYAHYKTSYGNILDLKNINNLKQEVRARGLAFETLCSLDRIIDAVLNGECNTFEIAEYLSVTEEFLNESIKYHKRKHGSFCIHNGFLINFEPTINVISVNK